MLLLVLVVLSTKKLHTRVKNKIYLLLQFIKKIVKFKFFFIAEFDISTSTKKLEILKSPKKLASFTLFQLNRMRNYYLQFFHRFYLEWLIQNYDCIIWNLSEGSRIMTTMGMILKGDVYFKFTSFRNFSKRAEIF